MRPVIRAGSWEIPKWRKWICLIICIRFSISSTEIWNAYVSSKWGPHLSKMLSSVLARARSDQWNYWIQYRAVGGFHFLKMRNIISEPPVISPGLVRASLLGYERVTRTIKRSLVCWANHRKQTATMLERLILRRYQIVIWHASIDFMRIARKWCRRTVFGVFETWCTRTKWNGYCLFWWQKCLFPRVGFPEYRQISVCPSTIFLACWVLN